MLFHQPSDSFPWFPQTAVEQLWELGGMDSNYIWRVETSCNLNPLMQQGFPNLYQHIHLHQQATDAINFKIISSLLLGTN